MRNLFRSLIACFGLLLFMAPAHAACTLTYGSVGTGAGVPTAQAEFLKQICDSQTGTPTVSAGGNVASGATDSGNPVKVGGKYNATKPTFTDGQRGDLQIGTRGSLITALGNADGTGTLNVGNTADGTSSSTNQILATSPLFNGATLDRPFTCTNTAAVSVTAGNTTEIVALTASQVIRVCGFTVSMSAAGTAQWVYGTGTNCASGTTNLTGAVTLATGTPWTYGGTGSGGSIMRGASANAICLAAVTGNVTGILTYAKY